MSTFQFELSFDYDNPGNQIKPCMPFIETSTTPCYLLTDHLYSELGSKVDYDPANKKSHRFKQGDTAQIRLFVMNAQSNYCVFEVKKLTFDLQRLPISTQVLSETPFQAVEGESRTLSGTTTTSISLGLDKARDVRKRIGDAPGSASYSYWIPQKMASPFCYHPEKAGTQEVANTWKFQVWTDVKKTWKDNNGIHSETKRFIFDPEMVVDPYT